MRVLDLRAMTQRRFKVLTAIGRDRPGLVKDVSAVIHKVGANIEDSRMAVLGGEFAMLILASGTREQLESAACEAAQLAESLGLRLIATDTGEETAKPGHLTYALRVTGLDHPGIVEAVTGQLAQREINVASLQTHVSHQPLTGTPTFVLDAVIQVPAQVSLAEFRRELAQVCDDENLDLVLEARA